ncbi:MAG: hypothetical protein JWP19_1830 [Rhodoglobus sp.]|nr:hypothetical protein [Rhodoglobus sp.]
MAAAMAFLLSGRVPSAPPGTIGVGVQRCQYQISVSVTTLAVHHGSALQAFETG